MWGTLRNILVFAVLCGIVTAGGFGAAAGTAGGQNQDAPLADAGLDQTVPLGATVYLDGGGSVAPDGELVAFEWSIETPDGVTTAHDCLDGGCVQASFDPSQTGVYTVTLTVTDDDGRTASDTLYVTVTEEEPPSVTLTGPDTLKIGEGGTFELDGERGDNFLSAVTWRVDGDRADRFFVDDERTWEFTRAFDQPGTYTVSGTLADVIGLSATATQTVQVQSNATNRFEVTLSTNSPVLEGDTATVTATIENVGDETATQEIVYEGPPENTDRMLTLDGGESATETFQWETGVGDAGEYPVAVSSQNDTTTGTLDVLDNATETPFFDVEITDTNSPVGPGEQVRIDATITNKGSATATQQIDATFPPGESATSDLTLAPGESTARVFTFGTDESDSPVEYPAEVSSDNASDSAQIALENEARKITVTSMTAFDQGWPDTKDGGLEFTAVVKNLGNASGSDTVTLRIPGEDLTIAKAQTDTLAPEPAGADECSVSEDCAQLLTAEDWQFVDVPEKSHKWAPDGGNGWWEYDNEDYWVHADTTTAPADQYQYVTPELPQFTISIIETVTHGAGISSGHDEHGVVARVQNTGDYKGEAVIRLEQTQSFYEDGVTRTGQDCSPGCTVNTPLNLDTTYVTVPTGQPIETGPNELVGSTQNDFQAVYEIALYEAEIQPDYNAPWSQHEIHDSATATHSWDDTIDPSDCEPTQWIEPEKTTAKEGQKIPYDVKVQTCDKNGNPVVQTLNPSEYDVGQTGNSLGTDYDISKDFVKIEQIPSSAIEGKFLGDWNVEIKAGQLAGNTAVAGAVWEDEDGGGSR
jgi:hypothetical protein